MASSVVLFTQNITLSELTLKLKAGGAPTLNKLRSTFLVDY